jgi:hypothetical protein
LSTVRGADELAAAEGSAVDHPSVMISQEFVRLSLRNTTCEYIITDATDVRAGSSIFDKKNFVEESSC